MKIYSKVICGFMILLLVCFTAMAVFADENEDNTTGGTDTTTGETTEVPATPTSQDVNLAQQLSTAYNITVTPQEIADLRAKNDIGYGGITLLYGLANASGKTVTDIIAMRQQDLGWGDIAKSLGLKVSDIMKKSSSILKSAKMNNEEKKLQSELNKKPGDRKQNGNSSGSGKQNNGGNNQDNGNSTQNGGHSGTGGNSGNNGNGGNNGHKK